MGMLNISGVAISGEGRREKDWRSESGTQRLWTITEFCKRSEVNTAKCCWYMGVDYINVILCTFMYT